MSDIKDYIKDKGFLEFFTGFAYLGPNPIDARYVVQTREQLESIASDKYNAAYHGLKVFVLDENKFYTYKYSDKAFENKDSEDSEELKLQFIADADNKSIIRTEVNEYGHLIIYFNDETSIDAGEVVGPRGIQGPPGPKGEPGEQGIQGVEGAIGPTGPIGPTGSAGPTGPQGEKGLQGERGEQGIQGPKGEDGLPGKDGLNGDKGDQGPRGPTGPKGEQGIQGLQGIQGIQGERGESGEIGPTGPQGLQGVQGLVGPTGPKGQNGSNGSNGLTPHIDPSTGYWFIGEENTRVFAAGPTGPKGDKGLVGPTGPAGRDGVDGKDGTSVTVKSSESECTVLGDSYIDDNGHLQILTSLDPRTFKDVGEIRGPAGKDGSDATVTSESIANVITDSDIIKDTSNGLKLKLSNTLKSKYDGYENDISSLSTNKMNKTDAYTKSQCNNIIDSKVLNAAIGQEVNVTVNIGEYKSGDVIKATDTIRAILIKLLSGQEVIIPTPENTPIIINGVQKTPATDYYFNSTINTEIGKQDVNGKGLVDCNGYYNITLKADNINLTVDKTMSIIGLMVYDELQKKYTPLGSGKKTFEELTNCVESETSKTYTLNSLGLQAANGGALQTGAKCIIIVNII